MQNNGRVSFYEQRARTTSMEYDSREVLGIKCYFRVKIIWEENNKQNLSSYGLQDYHSLMIWINKLLQRDIRCGYIVTDSVYTWWVIRWKHFPRYWLLCGEFTGHRWIPPQRPVTRSFDVFFVLCLSKRLSKQSLGWWFETPSCPLWRQCKDSHNFSMLRKAGMF